MNVEYNSHTFQNTALSISWSSTLPNFKISILTAFICPCTVTHLIAFVIIYIVIEVNFQPLGQTIKRSVNRLMKTYVLPLERVQLAIRARF